jgi:hypothetical protein
MPTIFSRSAIVHAFDDTSAEGVNRISGYVRESKKTMNLITFFINRSEIPANEKSF